ncbi:MAG: DEAD/DEAH box helicase [Pseudomonadota bacterium]
MTNTDQYTETVDTVETAKDNTPTFEQLNLKPEILEALNGLGYVTPSPIQEKIIPFMLKGRDVLGQAQTGTGKTAAFALPILNNLDQSLMAPQVLVLAPTRELAMQVAEAFKSYSKFMKKVKILPIYGGQDFGPQLKQLKAGAQIIVGTPGRMMDHIRRGTLKSDHIEQLVLDEADEMLRMGFIDDIQWIMDQLPETRQTALLSATMPRQIQKIAQQYLIEPEEVKIKVKTTTGDSINQRYFYCNRGQKFDALIQILESEQTDATIIFVRTKANTTEVSDRLQQRGFKSSPLNGDIAQNQREQVIKRIKNSQIDIIVATDVAARGLDVDRITHVINYDVPFDAESYVHRIGRTGRAGRTGDAILFIEPREKRFLNTIERVTNKVVEEMFLPTAEELTVIRTQQFKDSIQKQLNLLEEDEFTFFLELVDDFLENSDVEIEHLVAALVRMAQEKKPLMVKHQPVIKRPSDKGRNDRKRNDRKSGRGRDRKRSNDASLKSYRIEVGSDHNVAAKNILGAVCNEGNIDSKDVGSIDIRDKHTIIDLPADLNKDTLTLLTKANLNGQKFNITVSKSSSRGNGNQRGNSAPAKRRARKRKSNSAGRRPKRAD